MGHPIILLVHYDPRQLLSLKKALESDGFAVHTCTDGETAITSFPKVRPDVVVLEAMMPRRNGFEVCRDLKATPQGQTVPVVITSGVFRSTRHRAEALRYGCQEFLGRGFSSGDLVKTVRDLLSGNNVLDRPPARRSEDRRAARPVAQRSVSPAPSPPAALRPLSPEASRPDGPATAGAPEGIAELEEGEMSDLLDSLFPSEDSGNASGPVQAGSGKSSGDQKERRAPGEELSGELLQSRRSEAVGGLPAQRASLVKTPEREIYADLRLLEASEPPGAREPPDAPLAQVPDLDPRAIPDIGPLPKNEEMIALADEPLRPAVAAGLPSPAGASRPSATRTSGKKRKIYALALGALIGGLALASWMSGILFAPDPSAPPRAQSLRDVTGTAAPAEPQPPAPPMEKKAAEPTEIEGSEPSHSPPPAVEEAGPGASAGSKPNVRLTEAGALEESASPSAVRSGTSGSPDAASSRHPSPTSVPRSKKHSSPPLRSSRPAETSLTKPGHVAQMFSSGGDADSKEDLASEQQTLASALREASLQATDIPPVSISRPVPTHPSEVSGMSPDGEVLLRVLVTESGRVGDARVLRAGSPTLGDAALTAVRSWRYRPAVKAGLTVRTWVTERVDFKTR